MAEYVPSSLPIHLSVDIWAASMFWLLSVALQEHWGTHVFPNLVFSGCTPSSRTAVSCSGFIPILWNIPTPFSIIPCIGLHFHQQCKRVPFFKKMKSCSNNSKFKLINYNESLQPTEFVFRLLHLQYSVRQACITNKGLLESTGNCTQYFKYIKKWIYMYA